MGSGGPGPVPRPRTRRTGRHLPAGVEDRLRRQGRAERGCATRSFRTKSSTGPRATSRCPRSSTSKARTSTWSAMRCTFAGAKDRGLFATGRGRRSARRPQRQAHPAARKRTLADRATRAVATTSWCDRAGSMTSDRSTGGPFRGDHARLARRVTAALVDAMPRRRARIGLGPTGLRSDFADPGSSPTRCGGRRPGRRDICIYAREPQVFVAGCTRTSSSSTRVTPIGSFTDDCRRSPAGASPVASGPPARATRPTPRDEPGLRAVRDGSAPVEPFGTTTSTEPRGRPTCSRCATTTAP